jgi:DNA repair protein RecO (recombination protein O)
MTHICKTDAIVIKKVPFSNTSEIITFFTRDWGKITAIAKGLQRKKNPFEGYVELFSFNEILFIDNAGGRLATLTESTLKSGFAGIRSDMRKIYAAFFLAEFIDQMVEERDPHPPLFGLFLKSFIDLSRNNDILIERVSFTAKSLRLLGVMADVRSCSACGKGLSAREQTAIQPAGEGLVCTKCAGDAAAKPDFSASSRASFDKLLSWQGEKLRRLRLSQANVTEIWNLLKTVIRCTLNKELRTFKYVENG